MPPRLEQKMEEGKYEHTKITKRAKGILQKIEERKRWKSPPNNTKRKEDRSITTLIERALIEYFKLKKV